MSGALEELCRVGGKARECVCVRVCESMVYKVMYYINCVLSMVGGMLA